MGIQKNLKNTLQNKNVPLLVLDQKWHRLFAVEGKPHAVIKLEEQLNAMLKRQGQLNSDIKELKQLKGTLMDSILANMDDGTSENPSSLSVRKLKENRRLISEINEKLDAAEEELALLPEKMRKKNEELMSETIAFSYRVLRSNSAKIAEMSEWIHQTRIELKKNMIEKQNCETNSREIYSYMHDIFGVQVVEMLDLSNEDILFGE